MTQPNIVIAAHALLPGEVVHRVGSQRVLPFTVEAATLHTRDGDAVIVIGATDGPTYTVRPEALIEIADEEPSVTVQVFATISRSHHGQLHLHLTADVDSDFIVHDDDNDPIASDIKQRIGHDQPFHTVTVDLPAEKYEVECLFTALLPDD